MEDERMSAPTTHVRIDSRPVTGDDGAAVATVAFVLVFATARVLHEHAAN